MRSIAKGSALLATIGITFALAPPSFAQTEVTAGYRDENGNMHWGESRPEPSSGSLGSGDIGAGLAGAILDALLEPEPPSGVDLRVSQATHINNLGVAAGNHGYYNAAIAYFRQALQLNPADDWARRNLAVTQANMLHNQGVAAGDRRDWKSAISYFT